MLGEFSHHLGGIVGSWWATLSGVRLQRCSLQRSAFFLGGRFGRLPGSRTRDLGAASSAPLASYVIFGIARSAVPSARRCIEIQAGKFLRHKYTATNAVVHRAVRTARTIPHAV